MATEKRRLVVSVNKELEKYVEDKAKEAGISMSAVISLAIARMKEQEQAIRFMDRLTRDQIQKALE